MRVKTPPLREDQSVGLAELAIKLSQASSRPLRAVNPTVYTEEEFRRRLASTDARSFLQSVLAKPTLDVLGSKGELGAIGGKKEGGGKAWQAGAKSLNCC